MTPSSWTTLLGLKGNIRMTVQLSSQWLPLFLSRYPKSLNMPVCFCLQGKVWEIKMQTVRQVVSLCREGLMLNEVWLHKCLESPKTATSSKLLSPFFQTGSQLVDKYPTVAPYPVFLATLSSQYVARSPSVLLCSQGLHTSSRRKTLTSTFQLAFLGESEPVAVTEACQCFHHPAC